MICDSICGVTVNPGTALHAEHDGQSGPTQINGKVVAGYRDEPGISPESTVETDAAAKLRVDHWRWADRKVQVGRRARHNFEKLVKERV